MAQLVDVVVEGDEQQSLRLYREFLREIDLGLKAPHKSVSSKYLYDHRGSELFNQITRHPDYYLTRAEVNILSKFQQEIVNEIGSVPFNLIELGPGEGIKTELILGELSRRTSAFSYLPVDISATYLNALVKKCKDKFPKLEATGIHADYFNGLEWIREHSQRRNVVMFLGSSIGNFSPKMMEEFLIHLHASLHQGDLTFIGFDLRKDPELLLRAYSDSAGITRDFNFNLLKRLNRELGADFNLSKFRHYPTYNVYSGAMESYLVSLEEQRVYFKALDKYYEFDASEPIHVESSYKYRVQQIENIASKSGFSVQKHYFDEQKLFIDSIWQVN